MHLTVLVDNNTLNTSHGEWGLSIHLVDGDTQVLLDLGASDLFITNAVRHGVNLKEIDYLILSHGHWDHTWGLEPLLKWYNAALIVKDERPELIAHPYCFNPKFNSKGIEHGTLTSIEVLNRYLHTQLSTKPVWLTDHLVFLGQIPRVTSFEARGTMGKTLQNGELLDDTLLEDSALAYQTEDGIVIITGCSHSGICNIVEHAKQVCADERVVDIIGGFHLLNPSPEQLQGTVDYMATLQPKALHAGHCTDLASKLALAKVANLQEMGVGLKLEF